MSTTVFFAVLAAAVLHAGWNALVKSGADKDAAMRGMVIGQAVAGAAALPFVPLPAPESLPWIAASAMLHVGYQAFLLAAYRIGDLTLVYPLARGSAPLIVALVSTLALGAALAPLQWTAVALIGVGIMSISLFRGGGAPAPGAAGLALATGGFIAAYSLVDGLGARIAGTALGFYGWAAVINAALFMLYMRARRPRGGGIDRRSLLFGGPASWAAYALVIWAFTQAPIALVTALRETSILVALLIGVLLLGERVTAGKLVSTAVTLMGVLLLRLG